MNPFDFPGPVFLVFYIILLVFISMGAVLFRNRLEPLKPDPGISDRFTDPYLIAYLRGLHNEALRVAVVSLIDRGLLKIEENTGTPKPGDYNLAVAKNNAWGLVRRPIEKELIEKFGKPEKATSIYSDTKLKETCNNYERELISLGLLPDSTLKMNRVFCFVLSLFLAWGVAIIKIQVALMRGHHNIFFLFLLAGVFLFILYAICFPRRTREGERTLDKLKKIFETLKDRASSLHPGGATSEAVLLGAVFGLSMLPAESYPYVKTLYPKADSAGSSGCGSSCGSSGCGGGGGCGGGCGGCGGE